VIEQLAHGTNRLNNCDIRLSAHRGRNRPMPGGICCEGSPFPRGSGYGILIVTSGEPGLRP
jgi:hypothetical protein